jgi:hypothetical protein
MSKDNFINEHKILLSVAILGIVALHQFDKDSTEYAPQNTTKSAMQTEAEKRVSKEERLLANKPQDSRAAGQPAESSCLPAHLVPKLRIGPWIIESQCSNVASDFVGKWSGKVIQLTLRDRGEKGVDSPICNNTR